MDELAQAKELLEKEDELKSYPIAVCELCGESEYIYFCENGHGRHFCRSCLAKTEPKGMFGRTFIAKCLKPDCTFVSYIKKT